MTDMELKLQIAIQSLLESEGLLDEARASLKTARNDALAEAAKIAEDWGYSSKADYALGIRDAILALSAPPTNRRNE